MKTFTPRPEDEYKFAVHTVTDPGDFLKFTPVGRKAHYPTPANPEWLKWALKTDLKLAGADAKRRYGHVGDSDRLAGDAKFVFLHPGTYGHPRAERGGITFDLLFKAETLFEHGRVGVRVFDGEELFNHAIAAFPGAAETCAQSIAAALTQWDQQKAELILQVLGGSVPLSERAIRALIPKAPAMDRRCRIHPGDPDDASAYESDWTKDPEAYDLVALIKQTWEEWLLEGITENLYGGPQEILLHGELPVRAAVGWRTRTDDPWNVEAP